MNNEVEFTKVRKVKTPTRANRHDAGTDFYIPDYDLSFVKVMQKVNANNRIEYQTVINENGETDLEIHIMPSSQILIPSGIKVNIKDKNTALIAYNKSGVATKYSLLVGACVIDADYRGEIHINLHNVSSKPVVIRTGQKVAQFIHQPIIDTQWSEIDNTAFDNLESTDRGNGGFGSSGDK
jgi:dUTP pyrophosphatase